MKALNRLFPKLLAAVVFGMVFLSSVLIAGEPAAKITSQPAAKHHVGIVDDWSHHHLVFSNPGTYEQAIAKGWYSSEYSKWIKLRYDTRFILHQTKRGASEQQMSVSLPLAAMRLAGPVNPPRPPLKFKTTIHRDWSVNMGSGAKVSTGMYPAKFSFGTGTANCDSAGTPDFVVYPTGNTGAGSPAAASRTGTFTGQPIGGETATIGGTEVLTATPIAASATGTWTGRGTAGDTVSIGSLTLTEGTGSPNSCTSATVGTFARGGNGTATATNLFTAINACQAAYPTIPVYATNPSAGVVVVTAMTAGSASNSITVSEASTAFSWVPAAHLAGGVDATDSGLNFSIGANTTATAANLASAITRNGGTVGVTGSSAGAVVTVTATTPGAAGNSITLAESLSNFTWAGGTLTGGVGQASIVAYDNLYSACIGSVPSIYWQYDTAAGQILTSPVLSLDGSQVAFVQTSGGTASLVVLKWKKDSSLVTLASTAAGSYRACGASCMTTLAFNGTPNDTNSAPFYNYDNDTLYVGADNGTLHKFTGVFNGTPAEDTVGWPITVNAGIVLTSPVFDSISGNIFVGDASGKLWYVRETGSATGACASGSPPCLGTPSINEGSGSIADPPLVDSSTGRVFWFNGKITPATPRYRLQETDTALLGLAAMDFPNSGTATTTGNMRVGAFDNNYYTSVATGFLYVCGLTSTNSDHPALNRISFNASGVIQAATQLTDLVSASAAGNECSPITEVYNTATSTDWIFLGIQQNGNRTGCTGACIYSFNVNSAPANATAGLAAAGGTSGIIIDNTVGSAGASQIYFSPLANQACATGGTGGCAVQASQAALN